MDIPIPDPNKLWTALYFDGCVAFYRGTRFIGWIKYQKTVGEWTMQIGDVVFRGKEPADVIDAWKASDA